MSDLSPEDIQKKLVGLQLPKNVVDRKISYGVSTSTILHQKSTRNARRMRELRALEVPPNVHYTTASGRMVEEMDMIPAFDWRSEHQELTKKLESWRKLGNKLNGPMQVLYKKQADLVQIDRLYNAILDVHVCSLQDRMEIMRDLQKRIQELECKVAGSKDQQAQAMAVKQIAEVTAEVEAFV